MSRTSRKFSDFMQELRAETVKAGPKAEADLKRFEAHFRLARELIELRQSKGLTQKQLADASGVQQSDISKIESGKGNPTYATLNALAVALGERIGFVGEKTRRQTARLRQASRTKGQRLSA